MFDKQSAQELIFSVIPSFANKSAPLAIICLHRELWNHQHFQWNQHKTQWIVNSILSHTKSQDLAIVTWQGFVSTRDPFKPSMISDKLVCLVRLGKGLIWERRIQSSIAAGQCDDWSPSFAHYWVMPTRLAGPCERETIWIRACVDSVGVDKGNSIDRVQYSCPNKCIFIRLLPGTVCLLT